MTILLFSCICSLLAVLVLSWEVKESTLAAIEEDASLRVALEASDSASNSCALDRQFIFAGHENRNGLANRLAVLLATYYCVAKLPNKFAFGVYVWPLNNYEDHFLEIFLELPGIVFVGEDVSPLFKASARQIIENTWGFDSISNCDLSSTEQATTEAYSKLHLTFENEQIVLRYLQEHNIAACSAIHIRRTDLNPGNIKTSDEDFERYIESRPADEQIFMLADNAATRNKFLGKYGSQKLLTYGDIEGTFGGIRMRHTTMVHAIIEVFIGSCAERGFLGTKDSSFSELVDTMRIVNQQSLFCKRTPVVKNTQEQDRKALLVANKDSSSPISLRKR